ncbi:NAD(P)-binding domain-containing protein [Amycolatopsis kentuckyensis]|uniref:NAD(P)-binding domain-containing protein n=1 Tax=Amycolatopsis kentuckyensis TaxID=218823 RepID=UPI00142E11B6|nr:NAD(P)-binding domain-containing protein [Amycolatopsis kentuckyensis]
MSIIGTGNMARTIGALAVAGGNTVEVMGRGQAKTADLAKTLGGSATTGEWGAVPAGDIVIVALLSAGPTFRPRRAPAFTTACGGTRPGWCPSGG